MLQDMFSAQYILPILMIRLATYCFNKASQVFPRHVSTSFVCLRVIICDAYLVLSLLYQDIDTTQYFASNSDINFSIII